MNIPVMARKQKKKSGLLGTLVIILVSVLILLSLFLVRNNISQSTTQIDTADVEAFSGSSRYRYNAKHTGATSSSEIKTLPTLKWTFSCPTPDAGNTSPAVTDDTVYYMCGGNPNSTGSDQGSGLYALDKNTGAVKWRNKHAGCPTTGTQSIIPRPMEVVNSNVYTYVCGAVTALNSSTGVVKWRSAPNAFATSLTAPVVGNSYIYVAGSVSGSSSAIIALRKTDGTAAWTKTVSNSLVQNMALDIVNSIETLTVSGGTVIQSMKGADGAILWSKTFPAYLYGPALQYPNLYFGSSTGKVYAVDRTTGNTAWTFTADGATSPMMAVAKGTVTFTTDKGSLYAVNATTGAQKWKVAHGNAVASGIAPSVTMTSSNGIIYAGTFAGQMKAYDLTGKLLFTIPAAVTSVPYFIEPVVIGGRIYIGTSTGVLRAF